MVDLTVDPAYMISYNAWEVRVEGALTGVTGPGAAAKIKIWSHSACSGTAAAGVWVDVGQMAFTTPMTSDAPARCERRGYVDSRPPGGLPGGAIPSSIFADGNGTVNGGPLIVRVLIETNAPVPHTAWYDLVQAVPVTSFAEASSGLMAPGTPMSDTNLDGTVDTLDVIRFLDDLDHESAAADLDLSGTLDSDDITTFVDAFAEGW